MNFVQQFLDSVETANENLKKMIPPMKRAIAPVSIQTIIPALTPTEKLEIPPRINKNKQSINNNAVTNNIVAIIFLDVSIQNVFITCKYLYTDWHVLFSIRVIPLFQFLKKISNPFKNVINVFRI